MDLVRSSGGPSGPASAQPNPNNGGQDGPTEAETVYVETAEDLATVATVGTGLHLTTITVAVPAPLSPNELLQQGHVVASGGQTVALPTVPEPPTTAVRWKYEQSKPEKQLSSATGSSLVSYFCFISNLMTKSMDSTLNSSVLIVYIDCC